MPKYVWQAPAAVYYHANRIASTVMNSLAAFDAEACQRHVVDSCCAWSMGTCSIGSVAASVAASDCMHSMRIGHSLDP